MLDNLPIIADFLNLVLAKSRACNMLIFRILS
jgi:hypothetical protein